MIDYCIFSTNNLAKELALTFLSPSMRVVLWGRVLNPRSPPLGQVEGEAGLHSPENNESETFLSPNNLGLASYCSIHHHLETLVGVAGGQGLPRCHVTGL